MPALNLDEPSCILVTGANGFIGAHIVKLLLDKSNYNVHAAVRSEEKAQQVLQTHAHNPRLTTAIVPDVTKPDAYISAASTCDAIIHLAAPFGYSYKNLEQELLIPSIAGAQSACNAANSNPNIKRMIFCSSFASVYDGSPAGLLASNVYTEADWSPLTYEDGKNAPVTPIAYRASKVLAEKEVWKMCKEQDRWDLVSLCPGMVFGALVEGTLKDVKDLNTSNGIIWGLMDKEAVPDTKAPLWTSVLSLAEASLSALSTPTASNERFLVLNSDFDNQEISDIIHSSACIDESIKKRVPVGNPGERLRGKIYQADASKARKYLKFSEPSLEETVAGLLKQVVAVEAGGKI